VYIDVSQIPCRFLSINYYAWFGVSYFYYDIGAMFLECYHGYPNDGLIKNCRRLFAKKWLVILHHVFLPIFGFPVIVVSHEIMQPPILSSY
jgi:hypothetical protein